MTPAERQEVMERLLALPPTCRKCGGSNWYYPPNQRFRICQDCRRGAVKRYKKKKPEVALHFQKKGNLKRFGVTPEWYEAKVAEQQGLCATCGRPETKRAGGNGKNVANKALAIDHDHMTGQVRDLLCHSCNVALGLLEDDPVRVLALLAYLERHGKTATLEQWVGRDLPPVVVHQCPPDGSGLMPCCGKTPFEVPVNLRMTTDPEKVTCRGDAS